MTIVELSTKLSSSVKTTDDLAGAIEAIVLTILARAASWGASIPNAVMVARSAFEIFAISWGLSLAISISLELIGHALVSHWQDARHWNVTKRQSDPSANTALALGLVVSFFILDFVMVGVLAFSTWSMSGDWRIFIALCYPLIGAFVAVVTNERAHLFRVKANAESARKERAEKRRKSRRKSTGSRVEIGATIDARKPVMATAEQSTRERAMILLHSDTGVSGSELGRKLGLSERQGRNLKAELLPAISGNGRGIEADSTG